ncbi:hypothetical protein [Vibrio breoganii]|uniref:Uncharacterized protein n=1 Tax=Vibrio breoganii TaxID=553239 RepID=A0ABX1UG78_9VIBR|nr:hypothetical protein [Vibrio breoganii]NMO75229.1 hypothetical protein [Vibrio breoganii]NMR71745.1 hypothetical protein [Vibrio breoganii]PMF74456.1 hypothetical protein BCV08_17600 [Vibrio breoganii]PML82816.1 hypothetical protein BCT67_17930 [Vibrio breoganii]PMM87890.1 hypothetical protein BCT45_18790 [Vibrio breoganii]
MSSMAAYAIEMGMDPCIAPDGQEWSESTYRRPQINREVFGDDGPLDQRGIDTPLGRADARGKYSSSPEEQSEQWFATAKQAFQFAKNTPGSVAKRATNGNGFTVIVK